MTRAERCRDAEEERSLSTASCPTCVRVRAGVRVCGCAGVGFGARAVLDVDVDVDIGNTTTNADDALTDEMVPRAGGRVCEFARLRASERGSTKGHLCPSPSTSPSTNRCRPVGLLLLLLLLLVFFISLGPRFPFGHLDAWTLGRLGAWTLGRLDDQTGLLGLATATATAYGPTGDDSSMGMPGLMDYDELG